MFHDIIFKSKLPPGDLTVERLRDEGQGLVAAGAVTTERSLYLMTYYLLSNPEMLQKLRQELREPYKNWPDVKPNWTDLEQLPYLTAVIKEGFRSVMPGQFLQLPPLLSYPCFDYVANFVGTRGAEYRC